MKWILFLLISVPGVIYSQNKTAEISGVFLTYYNETSDEVSETLYLIENTKRYFNEAFLYNPPESFSIVILPSVWDLTSSFNVHSSVGAVWIDNISYLQPVKVLKAKGRLKKTLFTEYSHHFLYSLSQGRIPLWKLEGYSYLIWLNYSGERAITTQAILPRAELKNFSSFMGDVDKLNSFYSSFYYYYGDIIDGPNTIKERILSEAD